MYIATITVLLIASILTWGVFTFLQYRRRWAGYDELADVRDLLHIPNRPPRPGPMPRIPRQAQQENESVENHLKRELEGMPSVVGRAILAWRELEEEEEEDALRGVRHERAEQLVGRMVNITAEEKAVQALQLVADLLGNSNGEPVEGPQAQDAINSLVERRA